MKSTSLTKNCRRGVTLLEASVILVVILTLISIYMISADVYNSAARRSGCALVQDKIRKLVHSESNLTDSPLQPGVDYVTDPDYIHLFVVEESICPDGGVYTAILDANGNKIEINCTVHGNLLD